MNWLKSFFDKQTVIAFVAPLLVGIMTLIGAPILTLYIIDIRAETRKEIQTFRNDSTTFEQVTANYVRNILDDEHPDKAATQQLSDNLRAQLRDIPSIEPHLPAADRRLAGEYGDQIGELITVIPNVTNTLSMKQFWERTSKLLLTRNEILKKLPS